MTTATLEAPVITTIPAPSSEQQLLATTDPTLAAMEVALGEMPDKSQQAPSAEQTVTQAVETDRSSGRMRKFGRRLLALAAVEGVGLIADSLLIGAGQVGVSALRDVATRETVAGGIDTITALTKLMPHEKAERTDAEKSRISRLGRKAANLALGVTVAVVATKLGHGVANQLSSSLNHGAGEFVVPMGSKLAGLSSLTAARGRIPGLRTH